MWSFIGQHRLALFSSLGLHVVLLGLLTVSLSMTRPFDVRPPPLAVRATVVDAERIQQELAELEKAERAEEIAQQQRAEQARREAEQARRAQEEERQRLAELRRQQQEAESQRQAEVQRRQEAERQQLAEIERRREEERKQLEQLERERKTEQERLARLEEQRRQEEERRRQAEAEARAKAQREAQLQSEIAAEEQRRAQARQSELARYIDILRQRVERNWLKPASAQPGLDCSVQVRQLPDGSVIDVRVLSCNGDAAVVRSIENAVQRSSPLPLPDDRSLFQREIVFDFRPKD